MLSRTRGHRPAFSSTTPLNSPRTLHRSTLCPRRAVLPRKRPRRSTRRLHAVFIWSSEGLFGDDDARAGAGNDADALSDGDDAGGDPHFEPDGLADGAGGGGAGGGGGPAGEEHPIYGRSWAGEGADAGGADADPVAEAGGEGAGAGDDDDDASAIRASGRRLYAALRRYSKGPEDVDGIRARTSDEAADAFRRVVTGIFGTIPADSFDIVVNTERHGMTRLMQSSLATGYALRNAEYRMVLSAALAGAGAPLGAPPRAGPVPSGAPAGGSTSTGGRDDDAEPDYMRSVPRRGKVDLSATTGAVQWWDGERDERAEMGVADYVRRLEAENELLRERLGATRVHEANGNRLLDYMRTLSPEKIAALQAHISADALDAFKMTVRHVLGDVNPGKVQVSYSTSRDYMGQLVFWSLLVGYHVRNLEKKFEMTRMFDTAETVSTPTPERGA